MRDETQHYNEDKNYVETKTALRVTRTKTGNYPDGRPSHKPEMPSRNLFESWADLPRVAQWILAYIRV